MLCEQLLLDLRSHIRHQEFSLTKARSSWNSWSFRPIKTGVAWRQHSSCSFSGFQDFACESRFTCNSAGTDIGPEAARCGDGDIGVIPHRHGRHSGPTWPKAGPCRAPSLAFPAPKLRLPRPDHAGERRPRAGGGREFRRIAVGVGCGGG